MLKFDAHFFQFSLMMLLAMRDAYTSQCDPARLNVSFATTDAIARSDMTLKFDWSASGLIARRPGRRDSLQRAGNKTLAARDRRYSSLWDIRVTRASFVIRVATCLNRSNSLRSQMSVRNS